MGAETGKLLVVSNADSSAEICDLLEGMGYAEIATGDGGDDTVTLYEKMEPDVVVLCADLDHGDAQALVASMRGLPHGQIAKVVLIGEEHGPIRNALDAADFGVDRFVGRPLAPKALGFAVRTCVEAAAFHRESLGVEALVAAEKKPEEVTAPETAPASETSARAPMFRAMKTPPPFVADAVGRRVDEAVDMAIEDFVNDAIGALGDLVATDPLMTQTSEPPADAWEEPPPPAPREPTLILSGGGAAPPPAVDPTPVVPVKDTDRTDRNFVGSEIAPSRDQDGHPVDDEVDALVGSFSDDLAGGLDDDFDERFTDDMAYDPGTSPSPEDALASADLDDDAEPTGTASATATGGMFARELRRKMSQMAERLFPGRAERAAPLDVGVAHGHKTEIDLTSIGVDAAALLGEDGHPYDEISAEETFPDVPEPVSSRAIPQEVSSSESMRASSSVSKAESQLSVADAEETTARRSAPKGDTSSGELSASENDVASLIARLFAAKFTGRVTFRQPPAEKSIQFDQGRPVFATSNLPHDRMGDLLYREGKITRAQHARSRELVAESGRRMGEILIEMGFLKRRELLPAVRRHIEDIIYSLFSWDSGEFIVAAGELSLTEKIRLSRHPAALILEGVRRKYGEELLTRRLGSPASIVAVSERSKLNPIVAAADLSRAERAAIGTFDGEKCLEEVAEASDLALLNVYQLAFGLVILGVAEVARRGDEEELDVDSVRPPTLVGETDLAIDRQRVMAKYALVGESDYFALLGVRRDASSFEIKRAYEAARRDYASESFPAEVRDDLDDQIEEINQLLEEAYQVLRSESLRASYLTNLRD